VAAYAVVVRDGQLLLARSPVPGGAPEWVLPGGGMEHGEDPYDTVRREVEEETGYRIEVTGLLGVNSSRRTLPGGRLSRPVDHHGVRLVYEGRITGGELSPSLGFARPGGPPPRSAAPPNWPPGSPWTPSRNWSGSAWSTSRCGCGGSGRPWDGSRNARRADRCGVAWSRLLTSIG
jgi:8-oxo-dGTP diphosphatase